MLHNDSHEKMKKPLIKLINVEIIEFLQEVNEIFSQSDPVLRFMKNI